MQTRSNDYQHMKAELIRMKSQPVNIVTHGTLTKDDAIKIFRAALHDHLNKHYQASMAKPDGMSELELETLHNLIEGVMVDD